MTQAKPKWDITDTVYRGYQAVELGNKYRVDIENRLKAGEIETLKAIVTELEGGKSRQSETLSEQKTQTKSKDVALTNLHTFIIQTRAQIKAATSDPDKLMAFGIGEKSNVKSVSNNIASANMILNGYSLYKEWAQTEAGLLEEDIGEIVALRDGLSGANEKQEKKKFDRKSKTIDKNVLQRQTEDLITKISVIGVKVFHKKNPSIVPLFEDLIPGGPGKPDKSPDETENAKGKELTGV